MVCWGIPFIVIGQWMLWIRFLYNDYKKTTLIYAVTNRRVIVANNRTGTNTISAFLDQIPTIDKRIRPDGIGTLRFGPDVSRQKRSNWSFSWGSDNSNYGNQNTYNDPYAMEQGTTPVFVDIEDAASVYKMVMDLHEKRRSVAQ